MTNTQAAIVTEEVKFVTGTQAIKSARWPFGRNKFCGMVKVNLITPHFAYEGARPVYSVEEIDTLFRPASV